MKKILLPCLALFVLAIAPVCPAENASAEISDETVLQEESVPDADAAAEGGDSELRNTKAEEAKALNEETKTKKVKKAKAEKQTEPAVVPDAELDKPVSRSAETAEIRVSERKYETGLGTPSAGKTWSYTLGGGLVISPDYKSMMEDVYGEVDASTIGWVDLQAGLRYQLSEAFTLTPALDLFVNYFVPEVEDTFFSYIILPSLGFQYAFQDNPAYYLGADVSYPLASSGSDSLDLSAAGPGFSAYLGYMMESEWNLEFGYSLLPVENASEDETEEYNLGGFILKANHRF